MRYAMIMAGGAGTRLWPMSRKDQPKQLLKFIQPKEGGPSRSLLEIAAQRLEGIVPPERRFICTSENYRKIIRRDLPNFVDERILGEPVGRDTVNAVGFAAAVFEKLDKDAVFSVLTADHIIEPQDVFRERMDLGYRLVEDDPKRLVTFSSSPPTPRPATATSNAARPSAASKAARRTARVSPSTSPASSRSPISPALRPTSSPARSTGTAACSCGGPPPS